MTSKMIKLSSSCRTCMKDDTSLVDLYQTVRIDENCLQLVELLIQCTTVKVSKEDGLPQRLCNECVDILQTSYAFQKNAAKSEEEFKKLLNNNVKSEPPEFELKEENDQDLINFYDDFDFSTDLPKTETEEKACNKCNKKFTDEEKFLRHLETHNKPVLTCPDCNKTYHSQSSLNKHVAKNHGHEICEISIDKSLVFDQIVDNASIIVKTEQQDQEQVIPCPDCEVTFSKPRSLAMHMKKHKNKTKTKSFICDSCGKTFTKKPLLKRHVMIHSDSKPYKCKKCPKQYSRHDQYMHHIYTHRENKPYVCSHCKKGFSQLCSLKDHLRIHTGETPYLCSECGKGFSNSSNLRQHMMRHTGLKPYACKMCPKKFCTKGQMTSHMSTHTGEHPYKCEECGAAFTKPNSLKKHSFIHLGVKPFGCDTCNMRFTCKDHLKRHQRIHTGEKPYRCNYCDRSFTQSNDLVKHTRGHIGQNIYQCTICSTRFRLLSELKLHYPIHFDKDRPELSENPIDPKTADTHDTNKEIERQHKEVPLTKIKPEDLGRNKDLSFYKIAPPLDKNLPILTQKPSQCDKKLPVQLPFMVMPTVNDPDNRITITINGCDKDGVVGDITINIENEGS